MAIDTYQSMIILKVNGLNVPIKKHRVADWIKKKGEPTICCLNESHWRAQETHRLKVKGWKKVFHANGNDKKVSHSTHVRQNRLETKLRKKGKEGKRVLSHSVVSSMLRPHALQPSRLLCPWILQMRILEWVQFSHSVVSNSL